MIKSMTGFGKGVSIGRFGKFVVEARTVNHRFFEFTNRLPQDFSLFEEDIKAWTQRWVKRGKVSIALLYQPGQKPYQTITIDKEAAKRFHRLLEETTKALGLRERPSINQVLSFPDVIVQKSIQRDKIKLWPELKSALDKALSSLDRMRRREGWLLYKDISRRIKKIEALILNVEREAPEVISSYKNRLEERLKELANIETIDKERLALEVAIFAKGCDITEELTRAKSHIKAIKEVLISNQEAGRRLDFTIQELQREVNTLGQKAGSYRISECVIRIKSEIEKIREQVQNIE